MNFNLGIEMQGDAFMRACTAIQLREKSMAEQLGTVARSIRLREKSMADQMGTVARSIQLREKSMAEQLGTVARSIRLREKSMADQIGTVARSIQLREKSMADQMGRIVTGHKALYAGIAARIKASEDSYAALMAQNSLSLGRLAGISNSLVSNFDNLTGSYQSLLAAASTDGALLRHAPFITTYAPIEYNREVRVLKSISVEDDGTENDTAEAIFKSVPSVDALLEKFNDRLCPLLQGARAAVVSDNPDRTRHVTTSLRELITKVLHELAPDAGIRAWSTNQEYFDEKGRPTRRGRLLYICRYIYAEPLMRFVEDDVHAALSFVNSLHAGTHGVESTFTESQLHSIVLRTESLLAFLLQLRKAV